MCLLDISIYWLLEEMPIQIHTLHLKAWFDLRCERSLYFYLYSLSLVWLFIIITLKDPWGQGLFCAQLSSQHKSETIHCMILNEWNLATRICYKCHSLLNLLLIWIDSLLIWVESQSVKFPQLLNPNISGRGVGDIPEAWHLGGGRGYTRILSSRGAGRVGDIPEA